ncbi:hypothetical protein [Candidatus Enterovibrio escicola]|uniref:Uncharacterized protein n=1 Tax=Candidatus Enterovibrio escicola TaxID=1927127 RepID=A0A2A5SZW2_9GAMM|nr:hypothetical protein [Candidatus Enterovibrio escacola]PCS21420.1 hypothetical protein BTN49_2959 [Candidatus Enterovibrio escacola]
MFKDSKTVCKYKQEKLKWVSMRKQKVEKIIAIFVDRANTENVREIKEMAIEGSYEE